MLISGRLTAFGLGLPALIRLTLEGPSYNPEQKYFDAFAQPFSGDYNVQVLADKDGEYTISAKAYPFPALPSGPLIPENLLLLPSVAESPKPPLVVGNPVEGGVNALLPDGSKQFLQSPVSSPIEVMVGAPSVSVTTGGGGIGGLPYIPPVSAPPYVPAAPVPPVVPGGGQASIYDVQMATPVVPQGTKATGLVTWQNLGNEGDSFTMAVYAQGSPMYGPLATFNVPKTPMGMLLSTPISIPTSGLHVGDFDITVEMRHPSTGALIASETFSQRLSVLEKTTLPAGGGGTPTLPELPKGGGITFPDVPTLSMLGTPTMTMPQQVNQGDPWTGAVSVPTKIPSGFPNINVPSYPFDLDLALEDPTTGNPIPVNSTSDNPVLGSLMSLPVNFDTTDLPEARYNIIMKVSSMGTNLITKIMGRLYVIGTLIKTALSPDMFGKPNLNLPSEVRPPDPISGGLSMPTLWPSGLKMPLTLPTFPISMKATLTPENQSAPVISLGQTSPTFAPGDTLNMDLAAQTKSLTPGIYDVHLAITGSNKTLFNQVVGKIPILGPLGVFKISPDMILTPALNLPSEIKKGDLLTGNLGIPTVLPSTMPAPVTLPSFPLSVKLTLNQIGTSFVAATLIDTASAFKPGQTLGLPISLDTKKISSATYDVFLSIKSGTTNLFSKVLTKVFVADIPKVTLPAMLTIRNEEHGGKRIVYLSTGANPFGALKGTLGYSFIGFLPGSKVTLTVNGVTYGTKTADPAGLGQDQFVISMKEGDYTLVATNDKNQQASAPFSVYVRKLAGGLGGGEIAEPKLSVTNSPVTRGGRLSFSFANFTASTDISIAVQGGGGITAKSDASGGGSGGLIDGDPAGNYTLVASDASGRRATASFAVKEAVQAYPASINVTNSPVNRGEKLYFRFAYFTPNSNVTVGVQGGGSAGFVANNAGVGNGSFTLGEAPGSYTLVATDTGGRSASFPFTVVDKNAPKVATKLSLVSQTVVRGKNLKYSGVGFQAKSTVNVFVQGGGGTQKTTDPSGQFSGEMQIGEAAGTYILVAQDNYNHLTSIPFMVQEAGGGTTPPSGGGTPSLTVVNSPVTRNKSLNFRFSGFTPGAQVGVSVQGGGGITVTADNSGSYSSSFVDGDPAGSYTLVAQDSSGKRATAPFTVK